MFVIFADTIQNLRNSMTPSKPGSGSLSDLLRQAEEWLNFIRARNFDRATEQAEQEFE